MQIDDRSLTHLPDVHAPRLQTSEVVQFAPSASWARQVWLLLVQNRPEAQSLAVAGVQAPLSGVGL